MFKDAPQNQKYKSKYCKQFHEKNFCPYGKRCLFIHEVRPYDEVHSYFYVTMMKDLEHQLEDYTKEQTFKENADTTTTSNKGICGIDQNQDSSN